MSRIVAAIVIMNVALFLVGSTLRDQQILILDQQEQLKRLDQNIRWIKSCMVAPEQTHNVFCPITQNWTGNK